MHIYKPSKSKMSQLNNLQKVLLSVEPWEHLLANQEIISPMGNSAVTNCALCVKKGSYVSSHCWILAWIIIDVHQSQHVLCLQTANERAGSISCLKPLIFWSQSWLNGNWMLFVNDKSSLGGEINS